MEYPVEAAEFGERRVRVQTASLLSGPKLLVDGAPVAKEKDVYQVPGANGAAVAVRLKTSGLDPVPLVEVAGRTIRLAPPLAWYEYVWACVPILLIAIGGALGGAVGAAAAWINLTLFRSQENPGLRYALSALVTIGAVVLYLVVGSVILSLFKR